MKKPGARRPRSFTGLWIAGAFGLLIGAAVGYDGLADRLFFLPGLASYRSGHYPAAERDLRWFLVFENDPDGHYYLAMTYLAEGRRDDARRQFLKDLRRGADGRYEHFRLNRRSWQELRQL